MSGIPAGARAHDREGSETVFGSIGMLGEPDGSFDLVVKAGRIVRIERRSHAPVEWMLFPPLADMHVHANRAFTIGPEIPSSLEDAICIWRKLCRDFTEADYARHATQLFAHAFGKGTTRLRTHADLDPVTGLKAVRGSLAAREQFRSTLDVEVVAFASSSYDPAEPQVRDALTEARLLGATLLGAVPAYYPEPRRSIDALLELALELEVGADLHLDEHLDATRSLSGYLAAATRTRGLQGRVTLSHGCAMSALDPAERERVADSLAGAGITVIALPSTNLYLQDRGGRAPILRGVAPIRELARAGVELRFASDNIRDAFFPYGSADLLDVAHLMVMTGQLDDTVLLIRGICAGRGTLEVEREASFVLVRGSTLAEVLAERPAERIVVRHGVQLPNPAALGRASAAEAFQPA